MYCIDLAQDRGRLAGAGERVNAPSGYVKCVEIINWGCVSFSGRTLLRGVSFYYKDVRPLTNTKPYPPRRYNAIEIAL
jgi:hypothetical protein